MDVQQPPLAIDWATLGQSEFDLAGTPATAVQGTGLRATVMHQHSVGTVAGSAATRGCVITNVGHWKTGTGVVRVGSVITLRAQVRSEALVATRQWSCRL